MCLHNGSNCPTASEGQADDHVFRDNQTDPPKTTPGLLLGGRHDYQAMRSTAVAGRTEHS
jgi:hypothetical protein